LSKRGASFCDKEGLCGLTYVHTLDPVTLSEYRASDLLSAVDGPQILEDSFPSRSTKCLIGS
jgi:hypothetical protein